jgi:hypothetical protein
VEFRRKTDLQTRKAHIRLRTKKNRSSPRTTTMYNQINQDVVVSPNGSCFCNEKWGGLRVTPHKNSENVWTKRSRFQFWFSVQHEAELFEFPTISDNVFSSETFNDDTWWH